MSSRASMTAVPAVLTLIVLAACTRPVDAPGAPPVPSTATPATSAAPAHSPVASSGGSTLRALHRLCTVPDLVVGPAARQHGPVPPFVQVVERIAESHRGLEFLHPVPVDMATDAELDARLGEILEASISPEQLTRRTQAWRTIGVIPADADLERAIRSYYRGQVLGFYVPETGELVSTGGDADPGLVDGVVLAHELTHALDDQHFDLVRVDRLAAECRDERSMAALGAVEGSAQYFATSAIPDLQPVADAPAVGDVGGGTPQDVPTFVQGLQQWPYSAGTTFIQRRYAAGGTEAVNEAIRNLPVSTEQILHPERYPSDTPQRVDVPDLSEVLGSGWHDLDVMEVGEAWLQLALSLRIDGEVLDRATPGWDGGVYRAWTDGDHTAVLLRTAWDTSADAAEFAAAMRGWTGEGSAAAEVLSPEATTVDTLFASDADTLASLTRASN
jgi:hypothetical protein